MDPNIIDEIIDALLPPIEAAETQSAALIQLLREQGTLNEESFALLHQQAANAAEIKSRALRLRMKRIFTAIADEMEKSKKHEAEQTKKAATEENPEHRDHKEGPPTKEEAAAEASEQKPEERNEKPKDPSDKPRISSEKPRENVTPTTAAPATEPANQQAPQKKAS